MRLQPDIWVFRCNEKEDKVGIQFLTPRGVRIGSQISGSELPMHVTVWVDEEAFNDICNLAATCGVMTFIDLTEQGQH